MIVDANVMVTAMLGRSFPDLLRMRELGIELHAPAHQMRETRMVLKHKVGLPDAAVDRHVARLVTVVDIVAPDHYAGLETRARARLSPGGQSDWPVLAAAMTLGEPILSNDRDFFGVGVGVWSTPVLKGELETMNA